MNTQRKCIIDNWSLEHAGLLLEDSDDLRKSTTDSLVNNLGGLSNFINSILLYDDSFFILNGFEKDWKRFKWFDQNTSAFITGVEVDELVIAWESKASYADKGISNYLLTSEYFEADLLISPERSDEITLNSQLNSAFVDTLKAIDKKVLRERDALSFSKMQIGIDNNFQFPSLTQYVLSEASRRGDLLNVIMQLRADGKIKKIINEIEEITSTTKGAGKFDDDIDRLVKKAFGKQVVNKKGVSIGVSVGWLSFAKEIDLSFFRRKEHLIFLKKLIACRTEASRVQKDFERIFKRRIEL